MGSDLGSSGHAPEVPMAALRADSQGIADIAVQVAEMTRNSQSSPGKDKLHQDVSAS
jgi:hypothetical protein